MDVSGNHQLDIDHHVIKSRLDHQGVVIGVEKEVLGKKKKAKEKQIVHKIKAEQKSRGTGEGDGKAGSKACGSCYGAESEELPCCNTCADVRKAYRGKGWGFTNPEGIAQCQKEGFSEKLKQVKNEGCHLYGYMLVNKVKGNFHFAPGQSIQQRNAHLHDFQLFHQRYFDMSHHFKKVRFGSMNPKYFGALDQAHKLAPPKHNSVYQYFVQVVPTRWEMLDGSIIEANEYSVTEHERQLMAGSGHMVPGVYVNYDISPILIVYKESTRSFGHFLTSVCAIIGGVFTVASFVDAVVYHGARIYDRKRKVGKYFE